MKKLTILLLLGLSISSYAQDNKVMPLIETDWLAKHLNTVVILDVRTSKKSFINQPTFNQDKKTGKKWLNRVGGHIPNAQLILYKNVRGDRSIDGKTIKHMVVTDDKFEAIMQAAGVNQDSHVVITTNAESGYDLTMASRMYWQVKYYGHDNVSLLNGGTAQWIIDGHKVVTSIDKLDAGNWRAQSTKASIFADSNEVYTAKNDTEVQIVDVRPLGQYLGTYKSGKVKAKGRIPTAKAFPVDLLSTRNMPVKFSPIEELKKLAKALGVDKQMPLITYCNSGHMASGSWFAFHELLGNKKTKLYDGSMHQWTHENRSVIKF